MKHKCIPVCMPAVLARGHELPTHSLFQHRTTYSQPTSTTSSCKNIYSFTLLLEFPQTDPVLTNNKPKIRNGALLLQCLLFKGFSTTNYILITGEIVDILLERTSLRRIHQGVSESPLPPKTNKLFQFKVFGFGYSTWLNTKVHSQRRRKKTS